MTTSLWIIIYIERITYTRRKYHASNFITGSDHFPHYFGMQR